ncbi:MAG: hypothetical protein QW332_06615 [Thermoproteota archaeon]
MGFEELIEKLRLRTGQIITETWYDHLAEALETIKNDVGIGGRLPLSKLPDGKLGKVLIAQGEGNDPVYADPECNIIKIAGTDLTPRDWSSDFEKLQNLDVLLSTRASETTLNNILSKLNVNLDTRASEATLSSILNRLNVNLDTRASETTLSNILTKLDTELSTRASELTLSDVLTKTEELYDKLLDIEGKLSETISKLNDIYDRLDFLKFDDKTLAINHRLMHYAEIGYGFHLFERYENIANNEIETLYLQNPSNSTRLIYIVGIEISTLAQLFIDVYRNPTITDMGSEIYTLNLRYGHQNTSCLVARKSVSFQSTTPSAKMLIGGGGKTSAIGSFASIGESIIIPPDNALLIQFLNNSGASTSFSVRVLWFEIPIE